MALRPGNPSPFWSPEIARQNSINDYLTMRDAVTFRDFKVKPRLQYDYAQMINKLNRQTANINVQSDQNAVQNAAATQFAGSGGGGGGGGTNFTVGAGGRLGAVLRALRAQESGGRYDAVNSGSGAMGAYQI